MAAHRLQTTQSLNISMEQAWEFFSSPANLNDITPPDMEMKTQHISGGTKMYAGQIITYIIKPVLNIPMFWMTEITHVQHHAYFVDEQRFGPYALWHHTHFFKEVPGGVEMTDIVQYKIPLGPLGEIAHWLFVKNKVRGIFQYRYRLLNQRFGNLPGMPDEAVITVD